MHLDGVVDLVGRARPPREGDRAGGQGDRVPRGQARPPGLRRARARRDRGARARAAGRAAADPREALRQPRRAPSDEGPPCGRRESRGASVHDPRARRGRFHPVRRSPGWPRTGAPDGTVRHRAASDGRARPARPRRGGTRPGRASSLSVLLRPAVAAGAGVRSSRSWRALAVTDALAAAAGGDARASAGRTTCSSDGRKLAGILPDAVCGTRRAGGARDPRHRHQRRPARVSRRSSRTRRRRCALLTGRAADPARVRGRACSTALDARYGAWLVRRASARCATRGGAGRARSARACGLPDGARRAWRWTWTGTARCSSTSAADADARGVGRVGDGRGGDGAVLLVIEVGNTNTGVGVYDGRAPARLVAPHEPARADRRRVRRLHPDAAAHARHRAAARHAASPSRTWCRRSSGRSSG